MVQLRNLSVRLLACCPVLASVWAAGQQPRTIDPTFLRRYLPQVALKATEETTDSCQYKANRATPRTIGVGKSPPPNYFSTMERGKVEIGAEILLRISREFAKSVEWL